MKIYGNRLQFEEDRTKNGYFYIHTFMKNINWYYWKHGLSINNDINRETMN